MTDRFRTGLLGFSIGAVMALQAWLNYRPI